MIFGLKNFTMDPAYKKHYENWLKKDEAESNAIKRRFSSRLQAKELEVVAPVVETKNETPSDIVFENDELKLVVEKGSHKRQKNFRLQDHLYYFKIQQKGESTKMPLLIDIMDFLHAAFVHILDSIKSYYEAGKYFTIILLTNY